MNELLYKRLDAIESTVRPLCIDAIFVGCCIVQQGHQRAGEKLIKTALKTAQLDPDLVRPILADIEAALAALSAHSELQSLRDWDG